jgi:hypothetical protein
MVDSGADGCDCTSATLHPVQRIVIVLRQASADSEERLRFGAGNPATIGHNISRVVLRFPGSRTGFRLSGTGRACVPVNPRRFRSIPGRWESSEREVHFSWHPRRSGDGAPTC